MTGQALAVAEAKVSTFEHIDVIRRLLRIAATELVYRGELHDRSKLAPEESDVFAEFTPRLKGMTYGSDEYKACLAGMKPALEHHYAHNRHHPEHFPGQGIEGMDLIDVLEMFIDWLASGKRHADGSIDRSIEINRSRFAMSEQLVALFRNTAKNLTLDGYDNGDANHG